MSLDDLVFWVALGWLWTVVGSAIAAAIVFVLLRRKTR